MEAFIFVSLLCFVLIYDCRFLIIHVKWVVDGGLPTLYGIVWATCMSGIGVMLLFVVPTIHT